MAKDKFAIGCQPVKPDRDSAALSCRMQLIFAFFLLVCSQTAHAGVKDHSDRFSLALLIQSQTYEFAIESKTSEDKVVFEPNTHEQVGIGVSAFGLGGAVYNSTEFTQEDVVNYGKTQYEDLSGSLFLGSKDQFYLSGYYSRFKGFFIQNSEEVDPSVSTTDPRIQISNLENFRLGGTLYYLFSPDDLSLSAHLGQSAQQTSSDGSWFIRLSYDGLKIKSSGPFIPTTIRSQFGTDGAIEAGEFNTASITLGYGHAFIWGNWFAFIAINLGTGSQFFDYTVDGVKKSTTKQAFKSGTDLVLGYNGNDHYSGLKIVFDETDLPLESIRITTSTILVQLFYGYRF